MPFLLNTHQTAEKLMALHRPKNQPMINPNDMLITADHNFSRGWTIKITAGNTQKRITNIQIDEQRPFHGQQTLLLGLRERQACRIGDNWRTNVAK